jgi:ArsR family transcriptional regulator
MARAKLEVFGDSSVRLAGFAKALAHPARIDILRRLAVAGELPCMAVVGELPLSQPACSRHINELLRAGLLKSRTVRTQILFRVDHKALEGFCTAMSRTLHSQPPKAPRRTTSR